MESVELNYHRFWHAGDILLALGTMYELYPDMEPDKYDTEPDPDPDALDVKRRIITVKLAIRLQLSLIKTVVHSNRQIQHC